MDRLEWSWPEFAPGIVCHEPLDASRDSKWSAIEPLARIHFLEKEKEKAEMGRNGGNLGQICPSSSYKSLKIFECIIKA